MIKYIYMSEKYTLNNNIKINIGYILIDLVIQ